VVDGFAAVAGRVFDVGMAQPYRNFHRARTPETDPFHVQMRA
jgi:hypothetical protein